MKKAVIAGASVYGLNNISDDAMLKVFCEGLHREVKDLKISLLARHPGKRLDCCFNVESIKNMDFDSKSESMQFDWFHGFNPENQTAHLNRIYQEIKSCNVLIIGGDPFIDITIGLYKGLLPYVMQLITLAKFLKVPVVLNGVHLCRPLMTEIGKELTKFCVHNSHLITLRENFSIPLFKEMGIRTDHMEVLADAAWAIKPSKKEDGRKVLNKYQIHPRKKYLAGVTFRYMYWKWKGAEREAYAEKIADICDYIVENLDADILFIPHCTYGIDNKFEDDRVSHKDIYNRMRNRSNAHQIESKDMDEILSLFALLDIALGNRRHTVIFSAANNVPAISFGEKWHVKPAMDELPFLKEFFLDESEFDVGRLKDNLEHIHAHRDVIKKQLAEFMPSLREKAELNALTCANLLKEGRDLP